MNQWTTLIVNVLICQWLLVHANNFANEWVVRVQGGERAARNLAQELSYNYIGQVKGFPDTYLLSTPHFDQRTQKRNNPHLTLRLQEDERVVWAEQQAWRKRDKRGLIRAASGWSENQNSMSPENRADLQFLLLNSAHLFNDELWDQQWYLQDTRTREDLPRLDLQVTPVFTRGITGRGVRVTVLDDGLEHRHEDIRQNYDPEISYDLNDGDPDPSPRYASSVPNSHGTRCAGEIAMAANNRKCGVGVAFNANIGGIRMLDGEDDSSLDRIEGEALNFALDKVDIYSASWGPKDDGLTVEGPGRLALEALERGVLQGRDGKGSIYVWAAGNGGGRGDDCNCDGYTSSIFTLSVGSASEHGRFPWYGEQCTSTLISTYSSGAYSDQMITTTDLYNSCTVKHTGTSAAAPLAAGIIALVLETNPNLTWRDVQHLVVWTADIAPLIDNQGWQINSAGLHVNTRFGFGLMNALALIEAASNWTLVPPWQYCSVLSSTNESINNITIISGSKPTKIEFHVTKCGTSGLVNFLEHVEVKVNIEYPVRGVLEIFLTSPTGTKVPLLNRRPNDLSKEGFRNWKFMSVHTWGEKANGIWTLKITDTSGLPSQVGWIKDYELLLYGTSEQPSHMKNSARDYSQQLERIRMAKYREKIYNDIASQISNEESFNLYEVELKPIDARSQTLLKWLADVLGIN